MRAARPLLLPLLAALFLTGTAIRDADAGERRAANFLMAKETAGRLSLDPATFLALVWVESRGDDRVVSRSRKHFGLTQVSHEVAALHGVTDQKSILDPNQNLEIGGKYLRKLLKMADGSVEVALHAYNAGWGRVQKAANPGQSPFVSRVMGMREAFARCLDADHILSCAEEKRKRK